MERKSSSFVIYPLLFAVYPVLNFLVINSDQISPVVGFRAIFVVLTVTAVLFLLFRLIMKDWAKAGLAVTWIIIINFMARTAVEKIEPYYPIEPSTKVLGISAALIIVGALLILFLVKSVPELLTKFLNVVAIVLLIFPLAQTVWYLIDSPEYVGALSEEVASSSLTQEDPQNLPDVYYIIVDGYGRADTLEQIFNFDNQPFVEDLEARGFYVASQSSTNYPQTTLSLASSMNFTYLDELAKALGADETRREPLIEMIQKSQIRSILEEFGYTTFIYDSGIPYIDPWIGEGSDVNGPTQSRLEEFGNLNKFEQFLWDNMLFRYLTPKHISFDSHRAKILGNLESLGAVASEEGPKFVVTHILGLHPPFIFDRNGNYVPVGGYSLADGDSYGGTYEQYLTGYPEQGTYINTLLLETIDQILDESANPPIIILQGDHGPGLHLKWGDSEQECIQERMSIMNAYYFPDQDYEALYDAISPVNSYRVVLKQYLGMDIEKIPDKSYFATWPRPYDFIDVTSKKDTCSLGDE